jgi:hypothetical protein
MPFPLLVPLLALKGAVVGRFVYRNRVRVRADRQFGGSIEKGPDATGHIHLRVGARELVVCYESTSAVDFVVSRGGMKWVSGDPKEVTDEDFKLMRTTLSTWAKARGSTVMMID